MKIKKLIRKSAKAFFRALKVLPKIFFYILVPLIIVAGISTITFMTIHIFNNPNAEDVSSFIVAIAASLFSTAIALNSLATFISNQLSLKRENKRKIIESTGKVIQRFNENFLPKISIVNRIIKQAASDTNIDILFSFTLKDQQEKFSKIFSGKNSYSDFQKNIRHRAFLELNCINGMFANDLQQYLMKVTDFSENTYGINCVYDKFKNMRIEILNYLESISISFINGIVDRKLIKAEFGSLIEQIIPLYYCFIYKEEGLACYPSLFNLISIWVDLD